jgi:hypothetical protein
MQQTQLFIYINNSLEPYCLVKIRVLQQPDSIFPWNLPKLAQVLGISAHLGSFVHLGHSVLLTPPHHAPSSVALRRSQLVEMARCPLVFVSPSSNGLPVDSPSLFLLHETDGIKNPPPATTPPPDTSPHLDRHRDQPHPQHFLSTLVRLPRRAQLSTSHPPRRPAAVEACGEVPFLPFFVLEPSRRAPVAGVTQELELWRAHLPV